MIFLSLVAATIGGGFYHFRQQAAAAGAAAERELLAIGDLKAGQIAGWYQERQNDADFHLGNPVFQRSARALLAGTAAAAESRDLLAWLQEARVMGDYRRVVLCDARGMARLAVPEGSGACDGDLAAALAARSVVTTDLHLDSSVPQGQRSAVSMNIWVPIAAEPGGVAPAVGALMLEIDPYRFLYPLIQSWPTPSPTAETLLVRRDGDAVLFLNDLRHRAGAALSLRMPLDGGRDLPAAIAVEGKEGLVTGVDYRGVPVLAAIRPVAGTPWFMVAKVDRAEIYAPSQRLAQGAAIGVVGMIAVAGLGLAILWQRHNARWLKVRAAAERSLLAQAERILCLNKYANDSVLLTDERLNILEANDRALGTYNYSLEELQGMTLPELRPPELRAAAVRAIRRWRQGAPPPSRPFMFAGMAWLLTWKAASPQPKSAGGNTTRRSSAISVSAGRRRRPCAGSAPNSIGACATARLSSKPSTGNWRHSPIRYRTTCARRCAASTAGAWPCLKIMPAGSTKGHANTSTTSARKASAWGS